MKVVQSIIGIFRWKEVSKSFPTYFDKFMSISFWRILLKLDLSPIINFVIEGSLEARYWVILNNLHKLEISAGLKEAPVDHDGRQKFLHLARASLEESEHWWRRRCHLRLFLEKKIVVELR